MTRRLNQFDQAIGEDVPDWEGAQTPPRSPMIGDYCRIEPLDVDQHLDDLFQAFSRDPEGKLWTYMTVGPFATPGEFRDWMVPASKTDDPLFHAIIDQSSGLAKGMAAYMRIKPDMGVIEVGSISYSPALQNTRAATEAMYLMMKRAFNELGYRRYEWKCDALNAPSRSAAERLGFHYEGTFKQAMVYKGRNRDTAWYAMLDSDWQEIETGYQAWLAEENFDEQGLQKQSLRQFLPR